MDEASRGSEEEPIRCSTKPALPPPPMENPRWHSQDFRMMNTGRFLMVKQETWYEDLALAWVPSMIRQTAMLKQVHRVPHAKFP